MTLIGRTFIGFSVFLSHIFQWSWLIFLFIPFVSFGQKIQITDIAVTGLNKTKPYILLRELDFKVGDSIDMKEILHRFSTNEKRILNTNLVVTAAFRMVDLNLETRTSGVRITCKEGLYIYPLPLLEFLDNDFNKWWNNYKRSFKTLSYGGYFQHLNLTGNGDRLILYGQAGFTKKVSIDYDFPYLNRSNTLGLGATAFFAANKEVPVITANNYLVFKRNLEHSLLQRFKGGLRALYRPGIYSKHLLEINGYDFAAHDSITENFNPDYFNGHAKLRFLEVKYSFRYDKRDIIPYAMKGWVAEVYVDQIGLGKSVINKSDIGIRFSGFRKLTEKLSVEEHVYGRYNINRNKIPYYFNKALGYDNLYVRGFENNVVDGQDYFLSKLNLRFHIFGMNVDWDKNIILKAYQQLPIDLYLSGGFDVAKVDDRFYGTGNPLSNQMIHGYGLGLDIVFYYNKLLRLEVSRNNLGKIGFFVHFDAGL